MCEYLMKPKSAYLLHEIEKYNERKILEMKKISSRNSYDIYKRSKIRNK